MKKLLLIVALIALILLAVLPANALTVQMSNPHGIAERDIAVYFPGNNSIQGYYNSTSLITLDPNSSYIFVMMPMHTNPLEDPLDWLTTEAFPFVQSNAIALFVIFAAIGFLATRRR